MQLSHRKTIRNGLLSVVCLYLLVPTTFAAAEKVPVSDGQKATVEGTAAPGMATWSRSST